MRKALFIYFALVVCLSLGAPGGLHILNPKKLADWWDNHPQETHTSIASFGHIPWGRKITGRLALAEPIDACGYIKLNDDIHAPAHPILIATRGGCPFYLKAHYAQLSGAKLLLIVDNQYEEVESKLMVDSAGQGESISIPSVLLAKQGGDKIIESLKSTDETISSVRAIFDFALAKGDNVDYHLWLSSSNQQTFRFLRDWKQYDDTLSSIATMQPHYAHFKTFGAGAADPNIANCICGGRYCATDPDGDLPNTGADVVKEDLRQICVIKEYDMKSWWQYVTHYDELCLNAGNLEECSTKAMKKVDIDPTIINRCFARYFDNSDLKKCQNNKLLQAEQDLMAKDGVYLFPSVTINGFIYRGNLLPSKGVFEAVCESFNTMPAACLNQFDEGEDDFTTSAANKHGSVVGAALIFLIVFSLFVFCCYRRYLKREMYRQMVRDVNIAVSQYIAFKDEDDKEETE